MSIDEQELSHLMGMIDRKEKRITELEKELKDFKALYYTGRAVNTDLMNKLEKVTELVKQMYFFDEDEKNNINSAIETAQNIGIYLDDLEESKVNVTRLWEIKEMLENLTLGNERGDEK